jgi:polyphosphate kinase 2 (PPK2 family)
MAIFNRSHYEDVLIVRVREWIDMDECRRRYQHINGFERTLAENGMTILKFFLHISKDEQRQRLQERVDNPDKHWKFNPGDLEERRHWDDYMKAYEDALEATSTDWANWYVVPSDSKSTRNLIVSSILIEQLESLKMKYPKPSQAYSGIVVE